MHCFMVCLITFNQVLWFIFRGMHGIALKRYFRSNLFDDGAAYSARFRVPFHMISNVEIVFHTSPFFLNNVSRGHFRHFALAV